MTPDQHLDRLIDEVHEQLLRKSELKTRADRDHSGFHFEELALAAMHLGKARTALQVRSRVDADREVHAAGIYLTMLRKTLDHADGLAKATDELLRQVHHRATDL